jgi:hypothetical protein
VAALESVVVVVVVLKVGVEVGVEVEAVVPQALGGSVVGAEEHEETSIPRFLFPLFPLRFFFYFFMFVFLLCVW